MDWPCYCLLILKIHHKYFLCRKRWDYKKGKSRPCLLLWRDLYFFGYCRCLHSFRLRKQLVKSTPINNTPSLSPSVPRPLVEPRSQLGPISFLHPRLRPPWHCLHLLAAWSRNNSRLTQLHFKVSLWQNFCKLDLVPSSLCRNPGKACLCSFYEGTLTKRGTNVGYFTQNFIYTANIQQRVESENIGEI